MPQDTINLSDFKLLMDYAPVELVPPIAKLLVEDWNDPPTALQLLKFIDFVTVNELCDDCIIQGVSNVLQYTMVVEDTTMDKLIKQATWRN